MTQSVFCDLTKSIIGKFYEKDPMYQAIDKVYTFYTCDCMKKAAEAVNRNFIPAEIYNLPRIRDRENSKNYFKEELQAFRKDLEKLTGKKIEDEEIRRQTAVQTDIGFQETARTTYYQPGISVSGQRILLHTGRSPHSHTGRHRRAAY